MDLTAAVWRPIDHQPVFAAFAKALRRHAGTATAALMHAPFAGPSRDELRRLLTGAGFDKVVLRIAAFPARFPSPGEFLRRQAASSPLGAPLLLAGHVVLGRGPARCWSGCATACAGPPERRCSGSSAWSGSSCSPTPSAGSRSSAEHAVPAAQVRTALA
jgi:hypothetical protein